MSLEHKDLGRASRTESRYWAWHIQEAERRPVWLMCSEWGGGDGMRWVLEKNAETQSGKARMIKILSVLGRHKF